MGITRQMSNWTVLGALLVFAAGVAAQTPAPPVSAPVASSAATSTEIMSPAPAQHANLPSGQTQIVSLPELQSLVAPVALYPDALLAQMLMAATYPLEVASATIWLQNNSLSGSALEAALAEQRWDNSVKSLVHFPEALKLMGHQLEWTHRLGDAYLVQPAELMQAVQALRSQARQAGHLQSGPQMVVSHDPLSNIIIMPTNPEVVYVPMYSPMVVYGPWPYLGYPPYGVYSPGWGPMAFGVGIGVGAALWATPYWGYGSIRINNGYYNRFNSAYNAPGYRYPARVGASSYWAYNGAHRYNVPFRYSSAGSASVAHQQLNQNRQSAHQFVQQHGTSTQPSGRITNSTSATGRSGRRH